jgi:hypothetical protein
MNTKSLYDLVNEITSVPEGILHYDEFVERSKNFLPLLINTIGSGILKAQIYSAHFIM